MFCDRVCIVAQVAYDFARYAFFMRSEFVELNALSFDFLREFFSDSMRS